MKYLVSFLSEYSGNGKKSNYNLVLCESYSSDISGMINLNKCFVLRKDYDFGYYFCIRTNELRQSSSYGISIIILYREEEEFIAVNCDDISSITLIKDEDVDKYIPNINKHEAHLKIKEKLEKSRIDAEKEMIEYNESQKVKTIETVEIPKDIDNWLTKLNKWLRI